MKAIVIQLESLTYDDDGNLSTDSASTYTWNTRNQLTGISGGTTASFVYDALGRRESKIISSTSTNFLYDGLNLEQELSGTTPTVNYLTGAGIDETLSRTDSGGTQSYLTDNLGSTLALTNSAGATSTSYSYEPYGNTTVSGSSSTSAIQYAGRENDGTGLYYYRARYYSPTYGRFISTDPLGISGSGINLYAYADGDPIAGSDPSGTVVYLFADRVTTLTSPPSYHLCLMLVPDNPQDFANQSGWLPLGNGGIWSSLSAHPQDQPGLWGPLVFTPNYAGNDWSGLNLGVVGPPCGESDTQFIRNLQKLANSYGNNLPYYLPDTLENILGRNAYMPPGTFNSNSFISGLIKASNGTAPPFPPYSSFQAPGYQNPVPLGGG